MLDGPTNGSASFSGGAIRYTPNSGFAGTDAFNYRVSDGAATSDASVTVTVSGSAPVAAADTTITHPNQPINIYVVGNDTDADGDQLFVAAVLDGPTNGSASFSGGAIRYTPNSGFAGTDAFNYRVSDGAATSDASVTVTVSGSAPVAAADTTITHPNQPINIYVVGNDTDADGDQLFVAAVLDGPTNGSASFSGGAIRYTPNSGFAGTDAFNYRVSDGAATSDASVTVTVSGSAPVAAADTATTHLNQPINIYVVGNDTDTDGDQLFVAAVLDGPTNGSASFSGGAIRYTPNSGFAGTDAFNYRVSDGAATSDASVTVTVLPT